IFSTAVIMFVICVLPGDCYWMWLSFRTNEYHPYDEHLQAFSAIILYANSAINPFIFGAVQMICHRTLRSQVMEQLTSTTGFSRSKGSGSSVGTVEGLHRKSFSRTAIRKNTNYTILKTRDEAPNGPNAKDANNTIPGEHGTKLRYRDTDNRLRDTSQDCRDTNQEFRDTNGEQQDTKKLCDSDQKSRDTSRAQCHTEEPQRDTNREERDTSEASQCKSNETLNDARSISSDSSATLNRDSDTFSLTSETVQNTNCELTKQPDNTDRQYYNTNERIVQHALQESSNETEDSEPNTLRNTRWPERDVNKSTENDLQNTKSSECEKDNSSDFCGSSEFGLDKNRNILQFMRETNL
ncbi:neuropeptide FF receptor 2-like, partial [Paramuricea clavata]